MHDSADTFIVLRFIFMYPTNRGEVGAKNCSQTCPPDFYNGAQRRRLVA